MYLSLVTSTSGQPINLNDVDRHHDDVWSLFPGHNKNDRHFVFRTSRKGYMIVSKDLPITTNGQWDVQSKDFSAISSLPKNTRLVFKTLVNATEQKEKYEIVDNFIHHLKMNAVGNAISQWPTSSQIYEKAFGAWFQRNSSRWGCSVNSSFVEARKDIPMGKYHIKACDISGELTVEDPTLFAETLLQGIGDRKDRGFGMIMVAGGE